MTYQLFYASGSAAQGVRVILEELGVPYELIKSTIDRNEQRPPEQLKVNPNARRSPTWTRWWTLSGHCVGNVLALGGHRSHNAHTMPTYMYAYVHIYIYIYI